MDTKKRLKASLGGAVVPIKEENGVEGDSATENVEQEALIKKFEDFTP